MQIGLISDVHANVVALETVLDDAPAVDQWIHAGDIVGYGPWPSETIELFRDRDIISIQGNHDRGAYGDFHENFDGLPRDLIEWTTEQLSEEELAFLKRLPVELTYDEGRVHVAHGAPDAPNTYTYPDEMDASLIGEEIVLVLGHTHCQALEEFDEGTIVNPGSVGQPRDKDWRAAYALLNLDTYQVELHRVEYPYEDVQEEMRKLEFPDRLIDAYEEGFIVPTERAEQK